MEVTYSPTWEPTSKRNETTTPPTPATTSQETSITYDGITFNFNKAVTVGSFVTGEPFAVSDQDFQVTSITPASAVVNTYQAHGAMLNPYTATDQGFDEMLANASGSGNASLASNITYNSGLNVDPGATGSPIQFTLGQQVSLTKSKRLASVTTPNEWQTIEKYVTLHVLNAIPADDAYPPSASDTTKTIWRRNDLTYAQLQPQTLPASFTTAFTSIATALTKIPTNLGTFGAKGEQLRRFRLDAALGTALSNYSADLTYAYYPIFVYLHQAGISTADRQTIADIIVRFGIQLHGLVGRGWGDIADIQEGAGQHHAIHPWLYAASFLLNSPAIKISAQAVNSGMNALFTWVPSEYVGRAAPGASSVAGQTFFTEQVGVPFCIPDEFTSSIDGRYTTIAAASSAEELLPLCLFTNGPASIIQGDYNNSNPKAACVAHMDRLRTWNPWVMSSADPGTVWEDLYDLIQPLTGLTAWQGKPDQPPYGNAKDDWFSAGGSAGTIAWDFSSMDYATETVTQYDMQYSLDGIQWITVADVAANDSVTGLINDADHYCRFRQTSASGSSPWSLNYDRTIGGSSPRGIVHTTGAPANSAPAFTTTPAVCAKVAPNWNQPLWYPVSTTLQDNEVELACGNGYLSGHPLPTFSFQWERDTGGGFSNIVGATSQTYTRVAADAGADLRCQVTASNGSGNANQTSNTVTAPTIPTLPATKLIDTDFKWPFIIEYETQWANKVASNCTPTHVPTETIEGIANTGAIQCDKTGQFPNFNMPLKNAAQANKTYRVSGQLVYGYPAAPGTTIDAYFAIRNAADADLYRIDLDGANFQTPTVVNFEDTIVVAPGETDLNWKLRLAVIDATGGNTGVDLFLHQLTVEEI